MLQPIRFANAVTLICVICQIIYLVVVFIAPGLIHLYAASMAPGYNLSAIETTESPNLNFSLIGVVFMALTVWIFTYFVIRLYNRWAK